MSCTSKNKESLQIKKSISKEAWDETSRLQVQHKSLNAVFESEPERNMTINKWRSKCNLSSVVTVSRVTVRRELVDASPQCSDG